MRNKRNRYNMYRKKKVTAYFLACYASKRMLTKIVRKASEKQLDEFNSFFGFYNDVIITKDGIRFNNHNK